MVGGQAYVKRGLEGNADDAEHADERRLLFKENK